MLASGATRPRLGVSECPPNPQFQGLKIDLCGYRCPNYFSRSAPGSLHTIVLFKNKIKSKTNIKKANFATNYKSLNKDLSEYDLRNTKWDEILKVNIGDVDFSFESLLKTFNEILDKHAPYKKLPIHVSK